MVINATTTMTAMITFFLSDDVDGGSADESVDDVALIVGRGELDGGSTVVEFVAGEFVVSRVLDVSLVVTGVVFVDGSCVVGGGVVVMLGRLVVLGVVVVLAVLVVLRVVVVVLRVVVVVLLVVVVVLVVLIVVVETGFSEVQLGG